MIDSAFILRVFGGFEVIEKSGDVCAVPIRPRPERSEHRLRRRRGRGRRSPCSPIRSHVTPPPDLFHSAAEGSKIKQMLSEMVAAAGKGERCGWLLEG